VYGKDTVKSEEEFNNKVSEEIAKSFERNSDYKFTESMLEIIREYRPGARFNLYFPSVSDAAPCIMFSTCTVAPISASPLIPSLIVPDTIWFY